MYKRYYKIRYIVRIDIEKIKNINKNYSSIEKSFNLLPYNDC